MLGTDIRVRWPHSDSLEKGTLEKPLQVPSLIDLPSPMLSNVRSLAPAKNLSFLMEMTDLLVCLSPLTVSLMKSGTGFNLASYKFFFFTKFL